MVVMVGATTTPRTTFADCLAVGNSKEECAGFGLKRKFRQRRLQADKTPSWGCFDNETPSTHASRVACEMSPSENTWLQAAPPSCTDHAGQKIWIPTFATENTCVRQRTNNSWVPSACIMLNTAGDSLMLGETVSPWPLPAADCTRTQTGDEFIAGVDSSCTDVHGLAIGPIGKEMKEEACTRCYLTSSQVIRSNMI